MPYVCYIDEAGCSTPLSSKNSNIQPVLVIGGLIVDQGNLPALTVEFLRLKRKYYPGKFTSPHHLDDVREEIKGSDVRSRMRRLRALAKADLKLIDELLDLLRNQSAKIFALIWVKGIAATFKARPVYTRSIQMACETFQDYLATANDTGHMIGDFRTTQLNDQVAHSIFTQKFRAKGDPFPRVLELPTFGVSNNHAGLQITDLICSALLFPMATSSYCWGHVGGIHVRPADLFIKKRYARRIKNLQYRYTTKHGLRRGGIWVSDAHAKRDSSVFFQLPPQAIRAAGPVAKGSMVVNPPVAAAIAKASKPA